VDEHDTKPLNETLKHSVLLFSEAFYLIRYVNRENFHNFLLIKLKPSLVMTILDIQMLGLCLSDVEF